MRGSPRMEVADCVEELASKKENLGFREGPAAGFQPVVEIAAVKKLEDMIEEGVVLEVVEELDDVAMADDAEGDSLLAESSVLALRQRGLADDLDGDPEAVGLAAALEDGAKVSAVDDVDDDETGGDDGGGHPLSEGEDGGVLRGLGGGCGGDGGGGRGADGTARARGGGRAGGRRGGD